MIRSVDRSVGQITAKLEALGLAEDRWQLTFQSRLGPKAWLKPYTDMTLTSLAKAGTKNVQVICPGFSADCLETLEEIAMENRDLFLGAGGEAYRYIPCLNDTPAHIDMLASLVERHVQGWEVPAGAEELAQRAGRAKRIGDNF